MACSFKGSVLFGRRLRSWIALRVPRKRLYCGFDLGELVSAVADVVLALLGWEAIEQLSDGGPT